MNKKEKLKLDTLVVQSFVTSPQIEVSNNGVPTYSGACSDLTSCQIFCIPDSGPNMCRTNQN
jgi:hypothetical protein